MWLEQKPKTCDIGFGTGAWAEDGSAWRRLSEVKEQQTGFRGK